jgi:hypothetical protein
MACIEGTDANGVIDLKGGYELTGRIKINLHASTAQRSNVLGPDFCGLMLPKGLGPGGLHFPYDGLILICCENG